MTTDPAAAVSAATFLNTVLPSPRPDEYFRVMALARGVPPRPGELFARTAAEVVAFAEQHRATHDVYIGVTLKQGPHGGAAHTSRFRALWADVDAKCYEGGITQALAALDRMSLPPSVVVHSGHGFHAYWLLHEPLPAADGARARAVMRGIARVLATAPGGVRPLDDVSDLARLVRLPGTFNHKTTPPKPVRVVRWHPEWRYTLRDFEELGIGADPVARSAASTGFPAAAAGAGTWTAAGGTIPQHTRNATLTRIAGALRARGLSPTAIEAALQAINAESCDPPLPAEEVARIARGMARYAPHPQLPAAGGHPAEARLLRLDGITPQRVRWLWPARIPLGKLTILDGDPGLGKSLIALDLAARVSTGRAMPDGAPGDLTGPAGVVLLSAEDDPADTIRPRLDAAGGDPTLVALLQAVEEIETAADGTVRRVRAVTLADIEPLRQAIRIMVAKLVIIDPLMAYLTARTDPHIDARVRGLLAPLAALAAEEETAVLVVRHLNKTGGTNPMYRGGGSIAFIGAARAGLLVAPDPDDESGRRRVLAMTKSNLAEKAPSLQYTIEATDGGVPVVHWLGESTFDARALLAAPVDAEDRTALEEAVAFLREHLAAGPVPARAVHTEARRVGIAEPTLRRAKARLRVRAARIGFGSEGGWMWALPPACDPDPDPGPDPPLPPKMIIDPTDDHAKTMIIFGGDDHLWAAQAAEEADPVLQAPVDAAAPTVPPNGPCPRCGFQMVERTCWRCQDSICPGCGRWTGSGLRRVCPACVLRGVSG